MSNDLGKFLFRIEKAGTTAGVVRAALDGTCAILSANDASMVMRDGDWCYEVDIDPRGELWRGPVTPLNRVIGGWVILHRAMVQLPEVRETDVFAGGNKLPSYTAVVVPIRLMSPIGALNAFWSDYHWLTEAENWDLLQLAEASGERLTALPPRCGAIPMRPYRFAFG